MAIDVPLTGLLVSTIGIGVTATAVISAFVVQALNAQAAIRLQHSVRRRFAAAAADAIDETYHRIILLRDSLVPVAPPQDLVLTEQALGWHVEGLRHYRAAGMDSLTIVYSLIAMADMTAKVQEGVQRLIQHRSAQGSYNEANLINLINHHEPTMVHMLRQALTAEMQGV